MRMAWRGFEQESIFMKIMYKLNDLFLLNVLWIVTSLPIITIGASTAALYTVVLKMSRNEEAYISRSYFKAFRENFKQGTILWLIIMAAGGIIYLDLYITATGYMRGKDVLSVVFLLVSILYMLIVLYIFPVLARFEASVGKLIKIASYLSLRHIGYTLLILLITWIPIVLVAVSLYFLPVNLIIAISGSAYLSALLFQRIFSKYRPTD